MVIRILGLLGIWLGLTLLYTSLTPLHITGVTGNAYAQGYDKGQIIGYIAAFCIGVFFTVYGAKWVIDGYGNKPIHDVKPDKVDTLILNGLRGWLILVGLGLVFTLIGNSVILVGMGVFILKSSVWEAFSHQVNFSGMFEIAEILIHVLSLVFIIYVTYLYLNKKKSFPKFYIALTLFGLSLSLIDASAINYINGFSNLPQDPLYDLQFKATLSSAIIWILYTMYSKRVRATFVS